MMLSMWWTEPWSTTPVSIQGVWNVWQPVALVAVVTAFLFVALAYMIGVSFNLAGLRKWAKVEFYQALASAILVAFLVIMMDVMLNEGFQTMIGGINPYKKAYAYLDGVMDSLYAIYTNVYLTNFPIEWIKSFTYYFNAGGLERSPFELFLSPIVENLHFQAHIVTMAAIFTSTQRALLHLFYNAGFTVFIPAGVLLRIFPWTRGAGGLLIAIGIGLAIVYPIMFTFVAMMSENPSELKSKANDLGNSIGGFDMNKFGACANDFESVSNVATTQVLSPQFRNSSAFILGWLSGIWLKIFYYPMLVLMVTFAFIRALSPLLGADITEIGQGLVHLL
ncbi:MAG: hypothetical protein NT130_04880 [Candidatus Micrarchaeota archaeon]|nr:hypothetical protein [Candidatus Micrarchaeota archaeon]